MVSSFYRTYRESELQNCESYAKNTISEDITRYTLDKIIIFYNQILTKKNENKRNSNTVQTIRSGCP